MGGGYLMKKVVEFRDKNKRMYRKKITKKEKKKKSKTVDL